LSGLAVLMGDGYTADYALGMPRQGVLAIVDLRSNLIWLQCISCRPNCFDQEISYYYDFSRSGTSRSVRCSDSTCADGYEYETRRCTGGGGHGGMCAVRTKYSGIDISGVLRTDEFSFGPAQVNMSFGCIGETSLPPGQNLGGPSGVLGLGRGRLSLVSQLGEKRFSYCLTDYNGGQLSPLFVGSSAGLSGNAPVTSAPFAMNPRDEPFSSFYYLLLSGMTLGESRLDIPQEAFHVRRIAPTLWTGGVITDVMNPYTYLVDVAYMALKQEVTRQLGRSLVQSPVDYLELCVAVRDIDGLPPLVLHFGDGVDVKVPAENYWVPMGLDTACMLVVNSALMGMLPWNETTVIGSYMQQNFHIVYDLENDMISFQAVDCATI
jgi:hypothetical protein